MGFPKFSVGFIGNTMDKEAQCMDFMYSSRNDSKMTSIYDHRNTFAGLYFCLHIIPFFNLRLNASAVQKYKDLPQV